MDRSTCREKPKKRELSSHLIAGLTRSSNPAQFRFLLTRFKSSPKLTRLLAHENKVCEGGTVELHYCDIHRIVSSSLKANN